MHPYAHIYTLMHTYIHIYTYTQTHMNGNLLALLVSSIASFIATASTIVSQPHLPLYRNRIYHCIVLYCRKNLTLFVILSYQNDDCHHHHHPLNTLFHANCICTPPPQGSYYSSNSFLYARAAGKDSSRTSTNFASIFAGLYLSLETAFKILATLIYLGCKGSHSDWRYCTGTEPCIITELYRFLYFYFFLIFLHLYIYIFCLF